MTPPIVLGQAPVLLGYGTPAPLCGSTINGAVLVPYREKYDVAVVCGNPDAGVDRYTDKRITVSPLHTIRVEPIAVVVEHSGEMSEHLKALFANAVKAGQAPANLPPATRVNFTTWYETVLLPKGTDRSDIRQLADVLRYGGKILSQEGGFVLAAAVFNPS